MTDEEMVAYLGALPARPEDAARVDRDAAARVRPAPARRPHAPGLDRRDRRRRRRRAARRGVLRRRRDLDPVHPPRASRSRSSSARRSREQPEAKLVLLAKHGLVTWGDTAEASYEATLDAVNRAAAFVERAAQRDAAAAAAAARRSTPEERDELLAAVLPLLRGAVSVDGPRILQVDTSPAVRRVRVLRAARPSCRRSAPPAPTISCTRSGARSGSSSTRRPRAPTSSRDAARRGRPRLPGARARVLRGAPRRRRPVRRPEPARRPDPGRRPRRGRRAR